MSRALCAPTSSGSAWPEPRRARRPRRRNAGTEAPVVDGDALRDLGSAQAASSIVRVAFGRELTLYRPGAHDAASGLDPDGCVKHLATSLGTRGQERVRAERPHS